VAYVQVARKSFRRFATYRGATFAGVVTNTVFGFLRAYILLAVFKDRTHIGAFNATDVVTYTFITQGLAAAIAAFGTLELAERIPTGEVVTDLYRPMHFQSYWLSAEVGKAAYQSVFRGIPPFLIGALFFHLQLPPDPMTAVIFLISMALAIVVSFSFRFIVALSGFWLLDTRGTYQLAILLMGFFSGFFIPIAFFPPTLARVAHLLPFASVVEYPVELFLGQHRGAGATAGILAQQLAWAVVLFMVGEILVRRALRKVIIQGG
jgi:ABC-2 type transport system permease protein